MKKVLVAIVIVTFAHHALAGNCDHAWQRAKDGSICGGRPADDRPGGE